MHDRHIDPRDFLPAILTYGRAQQQEAFEIHLHFLKGCPECLRRVLEHVGLSSFEELAALDFPAGELPELEARVELAPLLAWLESQPQTEWLRIAREDGRFHRGGVLLQVLDRCRERWGTSREEALRWSELAIELVERVDSIHDYFFAAGLRLDLCARAWAYRGNLYRMAGQLRHAEACFTKALEPLKLYQVEPRTEAEVLCLHSSLLRAQRRFEEARRAIDQAVEHYECMGQWHEQGRALLVRVPLQSEVGDWEAGLRDLDRALPLLSSRNLTDVARLAMSAVSARLRLLWQAGRYEEATRYLPEAEELAAQSPQAEDRLRILWCKAAITAGLGQTEEAVDLYRQIHAGFLLARSAYDVALVSLELAALYLDQGRWSEIQELASEAIPLFECRHVHREALAAWRLFAEAAQHEALERATVERMREYLEAARLDPSYRYSL